MKEICQQEAGLNVLWVEAHGLAQLHGRILVPLELGQHDGCLDHPCIITVGRVCHRGLAPLERLLGGLFSLPLAEVQFVRIVQCNDEAIQKHQKCD